MISPEILRGLLPPNEFERTLPDLAPRFAEIGAGLRMRLRDFIGAENYLGHQLRTSGLIGVGIFNLPKGEKKFPVDAKLEYQNYALGVMLFRGEPASSDSDFYIGTIGLGDARFPIVQTYANFNTHQGPPDGYVCAHFQDANGNPCGITAGHVVAKISKGAIVPVYCSACGHQAQLVRKMPGLLDAAFVQFSCPGPVSWPHVTAPVRSAIESETVTAHFGFSGKAQATVMQSLQSPTQILSAAAPVHFLIDVHGQEGDSGSLVASDENTKNPADLIGMYLGDADCENYGQLVKYGYGIDLGQVAAIGGATNLVGEFHV